MATERAFIREERWTRMVDGRSETAVVDVVRRSDFDGEGSQIVEVSYELLAQMLTDLGMTREDA